MGVGISSAETAPVALNVNQVTAETPKPAQQTETPFAPEAVAASPTADELGQQTIDNDRFNAVPEHSVSREDLIKGVGKCPFAGDMGKAAVELVLKHSEAQNDPNRGPTIRELMEAKRKQAQSNDAATKEPKTRIAKNTVLTATKAAEHKPEIRSDTITPLENVTEDSVAREHTARIIEVVLHATEASTIKDPKPVDLTVRQVEQLEHAMVNNLAEKARVPQTIDLDTPKIAENNRRHHVSIPMPESPDEQVVTSERFREDEAAEQITHQPRILTENIPTPKANFADLEQREIEDVPRIQSRALPMSAEELIRDNLAIAEAATQFDEINAKAEPDTSFTEDIFVIRLTNKASNIDGFGDKQVAPETATHYEAPEKLDTVANTMEDVPTDFEDLLRKLGLQEILAKMDSVIGGEDAEMADASLADTNSDSAPEVPTNITETSTAEKDVGRDARERITSLKLQQELTSYLSLLEPGKIEATQTILNDLMDAAQISHMRHNVGSAEADTPKKEIEQLFVQLLESIKPEYSYEAVRNILQSILLPELTPEVIDEGQPSIDQLNFLGTHEYKPISTTSLFTSLLQMVKDKIESHLRIGKYALSASLA
jgi:hypothetical protein